MNKKIMQGKWRRMRGNLKMEWGRLTENDRRQLDGKLDQMLGLVQERYGYTQEGASKLLTHYLGDYSKRRHGTPPTARWTPLLTMAGIFSIAAMGWFFFSRFLVEAPPSRAAKVATPDYAASPEVALM